MKQFFAKKDELKKKKKNKESKEKDVKVEESIPTKPVGKVVVAKEKKVEEKKETKDEKQTTITWKNETSKYLNENKGIPIKIIKGKVDNNFPQFQPQVEKPNIEKVENPISKEEEVIEVLKKEKKKEKSTEKKIRGDHDKLAKELGEKKKKKGKNKNL